MGGRADRAAAQQVQRAVVGDAPGRGGAFLQLVQVMGGGRRCLHHIFAVDHRADQARAVAVELRSQLAGERNELSMALFARV